MKSKTKILLCLLLAACLALSFAACGAKEAEEPAADGTKETMSFSFELDGKSVLVTVDVSGGWSAEASTGAIYLFDGENDGERAAIAHGYVIDQAEYDANVAEYSSYDSFTEVDGGVKFSEMEGGSNKYLFSVGNGLYYMIAASQSADAESIYARFDVEAGDAVPAAETPAKRTMTAYRADGSAVILEDGGDGSWKSADGLLYYLGEDGVLRARGAEDLYTELPVPTAANAPVIERQDGERFEAVIILEGMEETVQYEHIVRGDLGFEMDYDYESFERYSDPELESFLSVWDGPGNPENFLEVTFSAEDADTVAAAVREELSQTYDLYEETRELNRAGECLYIEASVLKGTNNMADQLQMVYIIPTTDGCIVATVHCAAEAAEGFGRRFSYMLNTLKVIDRIDRYAESADVANAGRLSDGWTGEDFGEQPGYEYEWTGEDFGEQPGYEYEWTGEDFGEQPGYEDGWTGRDFGELSEQELGGWTGADFGELPAEDFGG